MNGQSTDALHSGVKLKSTRWSQSSNTRDRWKPGSRNHALLRQPKRKKSRLLTSVPLWGAWGPWNVYWFSPSWAALQYMQTPSEIHDATTFNVLWMNFSSPFIPTKIPRYGPQIGSAFCLPLFCPHGSTVMNRPSCNSVKLWTSHESITSNVSVKAFELSKVQSRIRLSQEFSCSHKIEETVQV